MNAKYDHFDIFLEKHVGVIGPWQLLVFFVTSVVTHLPHITYPQLAFLTPDHHCAQPLLEANGWSMDMIKESTIPYSLDGKGYDSCRQFNVSADSLLEIGNTSFTRPDNTTSVIPCRYGWSFDEETADFPNSFTREFGLVCEKKYLIPLMSMAYMFGMLVGFLIGGYLSDRYGRANVWCISGLAAFVCGGAAAASVSPWMFFAFRIVLGTLVSMSSNSGYVLSMEITNEKHRNTFNFIFYLLYNIGVVFSVLVAYLTLNWRLYHAGITFITLLAIFRLCLIPESPRWLLCHGRTAEAQRVLRTAARMNGRKGLDIDDFASLSATNFEKQTKETSKTSWYAIFIDLQVCRITFPMMVIWILLSVVYYGVSYFAVRLEGNPFVIAAVAGVMGLPAQVLKFILYHFFDRRKPLIGVLSALGLVCGAGFVSQLLIGRDHQIHVVLATVAVFLITTCYMMVHNYTPELFSTSHRSFAFGFLSSVSRIGAAGSMVVERLDEWIWPPLPTAIFFSSSLICVLMMTFISQVVTTETKDAALESCVEEQQQLTTNV